MILRDYQQEGVDFLVPRKRGFVIAPAGSGKTVIAANAVARAAWPGCRVQWLANTREQVDQGIAALERTDGPDCTISVDCVAAQPDCSDADIVVVDESHHAPASSWSNLLAEMKPSVILWGFSATPWSDSDPERDEFVKQTFLEFFTIERDRVLASGHLADGKVYIHDLDAAGQFDAEINEKTKIETDRRVRCFRMIPRFEHERRAKFQFTQEAVQANEARNSAIVSLIRTEEARGQSVLCLVHSIEHGELLASRTPDSRLCFSKLPAKKRRETIEDFRSGKLRVMFATSLADEGFDCPRASVLVLAAGGRSAAKLEQRAGRVLRPFPGKERGVIHDFLDRGAAFAQAQARARMRTYEKLGYAPEIISYSNSR